MGMKFLNKKGWHTGSLRNIENVWKAEQKHDQEQKKLEELRKQIVEERERAEFRQLQEQAGLVPRQERLDFLYDSGLAVGKSSEGFKSLEAYPKPEESAPAQSSSAAQQSSTPGALFEEKPQSANDAWRKLHSDPLLMIRQREQEALARIKNNPVKMAMIRRSVEESKNKENSGDIKKKKKHGKKKSSHKKHSSRSRLSDEDDDNSEDSERPSNKKNEGARYDKHYSNGVHGSDSEEEFNGRGRQISGNDSHDRDSRRYRDVSCGSDSEEEFREKFGQRKDDRGSRRKDDHDRDPRQYTDVRRDSNEYRARDRHVDSKDRHHQSHDRGSRISEAYSRTERKHEKSTHDQYSSHNRSDYSREEKESRSSAVPTSNDIPARGPDNNPQNRRKKAPKLSEEERAARLREMQLDAEVHEEQRWKRIKKADEDDAREAALAAVAKGKNFLEVTKKNVYGAEQGGSATIEESVRRRSHYLQGRSAADAGNAFRR